MTTVPSRDLRNHTADVLRQVAAGNVVTVTVNGAPVADITAHRGFRRASLTRGDLVDIVRRHQADSGLRIDLGDLAVGDTVDLGPIQ
jgi:prevent-host-death family protein